MRFVSLHTHTTFSYGDGYGPVAAHVQRISELGMKAVAFTEHGNVSSHAQLEKEAKKHGIKPIFGCEIYEAPGEGELRMASGGDDAEEIWAPAIENLGSPELPAKTRRKFHQIILAKDERGYQNLNRIVTASWRDGFFQWPTVGMRSLKRHREGLVVLSGCSDSFLSCTLLGGKSMGDKRDQVSKQSLENAVELVHWYQSLFGEDYYLEVQRFPRLERCCNLNVALAEISRITGARLAATSDVHYPTIEGREVQKILHAAHRGGTIEDSESGDWDYEAADLTYPSSDKEIFYDLVDSGLSKTEAKDAITATRDIAEKCNVTLPKNEPIKYDIQEKDWEEW